MQELNQYKDLPNTTEEDEAMKELFEKMENIGLKEMFTDMGKALANHEVAHQQAQQNLLNSAPPHPFKDAFKVEPVSKEEWMQYAMGTNVPDLASVLQTIGEQFTLLATVINQTKAQPDTTPPEPLQETIELLLKQSDWFKEMVRSAVEDAFDIEDYAKEAVEDVVESKVDSYFNSSFDASDHFDFHDAVSDCVSDQIQDAVSDKIDEAVEEYMSNATITIQRS